MQDVSKIKIDILFLLKIRKVLRSSYSLTNIELVAGVKQAVLCVLTLPGEQKEKWFFKLDRKTCRTEDG